MLRPSLLCFLPPLSKFFTVMSSPPSPIPTFSSLNLNLDNLIKDAWRTASSEMVDTSRVNIQEPTLSVQDPPPTLGARTAYLSQAQEFLPSNQGVFNESTSSLPTPTPTRVTLARGAKPPLDPSKVPIRSKLAKKRSLLASAELSVFDIQNTFWHCWFILVDHLRTNVLLAQKDEAGKISWVEFTPQFHAHLVKCAVVLVPQPIEKVKKVMFVYLLELLNGNSPQAFCDLLKGQRLATQAQKDKKQLA